jgi:hypothetical protein
MLTWHEQYQQDMADLKAAATAHYLRVLDLCAWHDWDQAELEMQQLERVCEGMIRYAQIMGGHRG